MLESSQITIEGYTVEELLRLPDSDVDQMAIHNTPIAFKAGSAEILRQFRVTGDSLVVQIAHIDGGGEGVLPTIWSLAERLAVKRRMRRVEWVVHAVDCAKPNLKLKRILELKGFRVEDLPGVGEVYRHVHTLAN